MRAAFSGIFGALVVLGLAACDPALKGECATTADCTDGRVCEEGLCVGGAADPGDGGTPDGGTKTDGGTTGSCSPACGADFHCDQSTCAPDFAPEVTLVDPSGPTTIGGTPLAVVATGKAPGGITSIEFRLGAVATVQGEKQADGAYKATLDLARQSVPSGTYELKAFLVWKSGEVASNAVTVNVDKTGPQIQVLPAPYPQRDANHPAAGMFLRSDTVQVDAKITDVPAGLSPTVTPVLTVDGVGPVTGLPMGGDVFRFSFDGRKPPFPMAVGDLAFSIAATDRFGNAAQQAGTVKMSRLAWQWAKPRPSPIKVAPAIVGNNLVIGSDDHFVYSLKRRDGAQQWEFDVGSPVVGHIAAGETLVYATTREGRVWGLRSEDALPPLIDRKAFRCPEITAVDGDLRQMSAGVAIGKTTVSAADTREVETLFGFSADGRLRMFRREPFPNNAIVVFGCLRDIDLNTQNDTGVPAIVRETSGDLTMYVGDKDGDVHKVAVTRSNTGVLALDERWKYSVPNGKILAPPAIADFPTGTLGVVVGLDNGSVRALDPAKNLLWPARAPLSGSIRASPAIVGSGVGVVDHKGKAQRLSISNGQQVWPRDFNGQNRGVDGTASMTVAADGTVYLPTGGVLNVLDANGETLWSWDTRPTGAGATQLYVDVGTPALACDGMLYVPMSDTTNGYVVALITDSRELAHDGWPKGGHDNRNTHNFRTPLPGASCSD